MDIDTLIWGLDDKSADWMPSKQEWGPEGEGIGEAKVVQKDRSMTRVLKIQKQFCKCEGHSSKRELCSRHMETVLQVFGKPCRTQHRYGLAWHGVGCRPPAPEYKGKQRSDEEWRFKTILRITGSCEMSKRRQEWAELVALKACSSDNNILQNLWEISILHTRMENSKAGILQQIPRYAQSVSFSYGLRRQRKFWRYQVDLLRLPSAIPGCNVYLVVL